MALALRLLSRISPRRMHLRHRPEFRERHAPRSRRRGRCSCPSGRKPTWRIGGKRGIGQREIMPRGNAENAELYHDRPIQEPVRPITFRQDSIICSGDGEAILEISDSGHVLTR